MSLFPLTFGIDRTGSEADFAAAAAHTHVGQAHLAGSGPLGETCRGCRFWAWSAQVEGWARIGGPRPARCNRYHQLMREPGKPVPHSAMACRHFEARDGEIPIVKPERA